MNRNLFFLPLFAACFFFSCNEKPKDDFENDTYVDITGVSKDTMIGNSGFRMELPSLFQIEEVKTDSGSAEYFIHAKDTSQNHSSIRLYIGTSDTTAPGGNFEKTENTFELFGENARNTTYKSGDHSISRAYIDDWKGRPLMIETITTTPVEQYNMGEIAKTLQPDTTQTTR